MREEDDGDIIFDRNPLKIVVKVVVKVGVVVGRGTERWEGL